MYFKPGATTLYQQVESGAGEIARTWYVKTEQHEQHSVADY